MTESLITPTSSPFDGIKQTEQGREYWSARDLQILMDYTEWRKFEDAIERAMIACKNSGHDPVHHFVPAAKLVLTGSGARRRIKEYHLTRYACYMVAMNSDPRKEAVSLAQTYFAIKTREAELTVAAAPHPIPVINTIWEQRLRLFNQQTRIPDGYWCIFNEIAAYCWAEEFRNIHLDERATPDISVALYWMKEVRRLGLDEGLIRKYAHQYPDRRGTRQANIYPNVWLGIFRTWFYGHYLRYDFPVYLRRHTIALPEADAPVLSLPVPQIGGLALVK